MASIPRESGTGMRSIRLSRISQKITWPKEHREIEPYKRFTVISYWLLQREQLLLSKEILHH